MITDKKEFLERLKSEDADELLKNASKDLKSDREVVLSIFNKDYGLCEFETAIKTAFIGNALQYVSADLKSDREVVLTAVKIDGSALQFASEDLRSDREVVLAAVKEYSGALEYASKELKNDREIVLTAIKNSGAAIKYASEALKSDREVIFETIKNNGIELKKISKFIKNDREIILFLVKKDGDNLKYASENLKSDREVVLEAVKNYGNALKYASDALKDDYEVVLKSVKKFGSSLEFASERLQKNPEIVFAAIASGYKLKTKKEIEKKLLYKLWGLSIVLFSMYLLSTESFSNFKDFFKFLIGNVFVASTLVSSFIAIFWRIYFNERIHPYIALLPSLLILGFVLRILPFYDDNLIQFLGNFKIPYVISKLLILLPIIYIFFKLMMWLAKEKKWKRLLVQILP